MIFTNEQLAQMVRLEARVGLTPPWDHVEPVWEPRFGEFRVFYDVDENESRVVVRALRLQWRVELACDPLGQEESGT